jgi:hypothetical protein
MTMRFVRTWLPLTIIAAGVIIAIATGLSETGVEGGALIVSAGLSVWLINLLYRIGVRGDREREAEDRARAYFAEHGRWPDEDQTPNQRPNAAERVDSGDGQRRRP